MRLTASQNGLLEVRAGTKDGEEECVSLIQMGQERASANMISMSFGVVLDRTQPQVSFTISMSGIQWYFCKLLYHTGVEGNQCGCALRVSASDTTGFPDKEFNAHRRIQVKLGCKTETCYLLCSLPAFNRANGKAKPGSTWDVWDVHIIREPLVPPVDKEWREHRTFRKGEGIQVEPQFMTP